MSDWSEGYVADLGYMHGFYRELSPALLRLVCHLAGDSTAHQGSISYCELGCGQGFTSNIIAASNPNIEVFATDFNPAHIVNAQSLARDGDVQNVEFFDASFAEFAQLPELPQFDIISLHGIYSWVTAENRETIIEFLRTKLKPGGIVYVSYNTLPGWAAMMPVRHLMHLHGQLHGGPTAKRLPHAMAEVDRMIAANAGFFSRHPALNERFAKIKTFNPRYLAHEYFNANWTPFYHSQVASDMGRAKLEYVGSAALLDGVDSLNLNAEHLAILNEVRDPLYRETIRDYLVNQQFRRDVYIRGAVPVAPAVLRTAWQNLRFALVRPRSEISMKVPGSLGEGTLRDDTYGPVLDLLETGTKSVFDLASNVQVRALGGSALRQILTVLVGAGWVDPCITEDDVERRRQRTDALNLAVLGRAKTSGDMTYVASPVTGSGVNLPRMAQLMLLALKSKADNVPEFVWEILAEQGQSLTKDGTELRSREENIAELMSQFVGFQKNHLPLMRQLGIADS